MIESIRRVLRLRYLHTVARGCLAGLLLVAHAGLHTPPVESVRAAARVTHSLTAVELLSELKRRGVEPTVTTLYRDGSAARQESTDAAAACRFTASGVLEAVARNSERGSPADWCELELPAPGLALAPGWRVQRVHWSGDVRAARFMRNPADSERLDFRVALRVPDTDRSKGSGQRRVARHRLRMQLVTLVGPDGIAWRDALGVPAKRQ